MSNLKNNFYFTTLPSMFDDIFNVVDYVFENPIVTTGGYTYPLTYASGNTGGSVRYNLDNLWEKYDHSLIGESAPISNPSAVFDYAKKIYQSGLPSFPASDIYLDKEGNTLNFELALPGYSLDDIEIGFEDDYMIVEIKKENAMKKDKKESKESRVYLRQGLKNSSVTFKVPVPFARFKVQSAKAAYHNGMLRIAIPREEQHLPHKLKIGVEPLNQLEDRTE